MLSTIVGTTLTATAASATPAVPYPPAPPSLVVNHGVVKKGGIVRATGRQFQARERVSIVIRLKPQGSNIFRVLRTTSGRADRKGKIAFRMRLTSAGNVTITVIGRTSSQSASASVVVLSGRKLGRTLRLKPAAFTGSDVRPAAPKAASSAGSINGLAIAGLAFMAGSALVTQRVVRRRRKAAVTRG
jgi:hypothetical protein